MIKVAKASSFYRLALSLGLPLGIWIGTAGFMARAPGRGDFDMDAGRIAFADHCGACHILEHGFSIHHGPNLSEIGKVAGTRRVNRTAAEYVLESILAPDAFVDASLRRGMPKNIATELAPEEIRNIIAFLLSHGGSPDYDEILNLEIPDSRPDTATQINVDLQQMMLGERTMRGKGMCLECHSVYQNAEHQIFAPTILGVGLGDESRIRESIINPEPRAGSYYHSTVVLLDDGELVTGKLISQTDDRLVLITKDSGNELVRREIRRDEIEQEEGKLQLYSSTHSAMPTGFDQLMSTEELEAVVRLIHQLN